MNENLLLHRLDLVRNDPSENKNLPPYFRAKVYVVCFTHSHHAKKRFWSEYTGTAGNGVRLAFQNDLLQTNNFNIYSSNDYLFPKRTMADLSHKTYDALTDWGCYDISKLDIIYDSSKNKRFGTGHANGYVKYKEYSWEEETRIRVAFDPLGFETTLDAPPFEEVYLKLSGRLLETMTVLLHPKATENDTLSVQHILNSNPLTRNCPINFSS